MASFGDRQTTMSRPDRKTKVLRKPYWRQNVDGEGTAGWVFLPVGSSHKQLVLEKDATTGEELGTPRPLYDAKGYVSIDRIDGDDPRRNLLPTNWEQMCRDHRLPAEMPEDFDEVLETFREEAASGEAA